jgi:gamma-glutamyltranspeptidase/glutathione hydrolase
MKENLYWNSIIIKFSNHQIFKSLTSSKSIIFKLQILNMKKLILFLFLPISLIAQDRPYGKIWATRSQVIAQHGMAATSHPLSTQVALDVLKAGGNAIDAAIAANAMEGVVEPHMNGIGGDLFAIVWDAKTKKLYGLNGSGRSPKS